MTDTDHVLQAQAAYDAVAEGYAHVIGTELTADTENPLDMAVLAAFVELVEGCRHQVADIGCGPGRVAALLAAQGIDVVGVDVSPAMIAVARKAHPGLRFETGQLTALPVSDRSLGGAVCWYSIIHTPPDHIRPVFIELARVLVPGGHLLLAFQAGHGRGCAVRRPTGRRWRSAATGTTPMPSPTPSLTWDFRSTLACSGSRSLPTNRVSRPRATPTQ